MIRKINDSLNVLPNLYRNNKPCIIQSNRYKQNVIPFMIHSFSHKIKQTLNEFKYCKIILMRNYIPLELFELFESFLLTNTSFHTYTVNSYIRNPKQFILSKLYRLGYIDDENYEMHKSIPYMVMLDYQYPELIEGEILYWM